MQIDRAILQFEDHRLQLAIELNAGGKNTILHTMKKIVEDELTRTELSLLAATRNSRLVNIKRITLY